MKWIDVKGNPNYEVSDTGLVRSKITDKVLKPFVTRKGYERLGLYYYNGKIDRLEPDNRGRIRKTGKRYGNPGEYKRKLVHQLVLSSFTRRPKWATMVNHKDGDKRNNMLDNLEWSNNRKNIIHAYKNGLMGKRSGENSGNNKLSKQEVLDIREKCTQGMSDLQIGREYGVTAANIYRIRNRLTWKHI